MIQIYGTRFEKKLTREVGGVGHRAQDHPPSPTQLPFTLLGTSALATAAWAPRVQVVL